MEEFAKNLITAMSERNITAAELSRKSGISEATISRYLSGRFKAKQDNVAKISSVLNVSPTWLMGYPETKGKLYDLTPPEQKIIDYYRSSSDVEREMLERMCKVTWFHPQQIEVSKWIKL